MRGPWEYETPSCAGVPVEFFYPESPDGRSEANYDPSLKRICGGCPHLQECGDWALRHEVYGYWANTTPRTRRLRRRFLKITVQGDLSA